MIYKLKGIIDTITENYIILDVNGVGYGVFCPQRTISKLEINSPISLQIETIVREDGITLYGFENQTEKEMFILLTSVQGIGPKASLSILSTLNANQISTGIISKDYKIFTTANGIGKKTAERIITELKDKIIKTNINIEMSNMNQTILTSTIAEDAISALSNLGYTRSQSFEIVMKILKSAPNIKMDDLIREALKEINKF